MYEFNCTRSGPDAGLFFHEYLLRGRPDLATLIRRTDPKKGERKRRGRCGAYKRMIVSINLEMYSPCDSCQAEVGWEPVNSTGQRASQVPISSTETQPPNGATSSTLPPNSTTLVWASSLMSQILSASHLVIQHQTQQLGRGSLVIFLKNQDRWLLRQCHSPGPQWQICCLLLG